MNKEVSIVRVDSRGYRRVAQENWGLSDDQMKGMHVHHRIPRSQGGTNDPSNLYVCSAWFHKNVWHAEDSYNSLIPHAEEGARRAHSKKDEKGRSLIALRTCEKLHTEKDELGRSVFAVNNVQKIHAEKEDSGKSKLAVRMGRIGGTRKHEKKNKDGKSIAALEHNKKLHSERDEYGRSVVAMRSLRQKWIDPVHPELGEQCAGTLVRMQKSRGYPHGKSNRVKVG